MTQEISGDLVNTRCPEIVKILSLGKRTGRLQLTKGAEIGNIFFQDGSIIHAKYGLIEGLKAVYEIAVWTSGDYEFFVDDIADMASIEKPVDEILTETAERIRQMDRISSIIPSSSIIYSHEPDINKPEFALKSIQWKVLAHVDGQKSISDIAQMVGLTVSDAMKVFYTLIKLGVIKDSSQQEPLHKRKTVCLPETEFMGALQSELLKAMGPIAPFIILETADEMNFDLVSDDMDQRAHLIETLSSRIMDEEISLKFLQNMTSWISAEGTHA